MSLGSAALRPLGVPSIAAPSVVNVAGMLQGGHTDSSFNVTARMPDATSVVLDVALDAAFSRVIQTLDPAVAPASGNDYWAKFTATGLQANTIYHCRPRVGSAIASLTCAAQTFPAAGRPYSHTFIYGSCADTDSEALTFERIWARNPAYVLHSGDLDYLDILVNDAPTWRAARRRWLKSWPQAKLARERRFDYTPDDHDGPAGNDSDGTGAAKPAMQQMYRDMWPHYTLPSTSGALFHSFVAGRCRHIRLDTRSNRSPNAATEGAGKLMIDAEQEAWVATELAAALAAGQLVFLDLVDPWIGNYLNGADMWYGKSNARTRLADVIVASGVTRIMALHGDIHAFAVDDGTNADYSTAGTLRMPVVCAAPFDSVNTTGGGPFSHGIYAAERQQYATFDVDDTGAGFRVTVSGYRASDDSLLRSPVTLSFP